VPAQLARACFPPSLTPTRSPDPATGTVAATVAGSRPGPSPRPGRPVRICAPPLRLPSAALNSATLLHLLHPGRPELRARVGTDHLLSGGGCGSDVRREPADGAHQHAGYVLCLRTATDIPWGRVSDSSMSARTDPAPWFVVRPERETPPRIQSWKTTAPTQEAGAIRRPERSATRW